jgi:hypothetical protein
VHTTRQLQSEQNIHKSEKASVDYVMALAACQLPVPIEVNWGLPFFRAGCHDGVIGWEMPEPE